MTEHQLKKMMSDAVEEALTRFGFDPDNVREMQKDMLFLRGARQLCSAVGTKAVLVIVGLVMTGIVGGVWLAIRNKC